MFERQEPLGFGVGKPQPLRQPLRILRDPDAERAEAADRVGLDAERRFDLHHVLEAGEERARRRAPVPRSPLSAITASVGVARAATNSFSNSMRTRSRDSVSRPARALMQACKPAGVRRAVAEMRVKAKEPQDAQIIFFDPPLRFADEAHATRGKVVDAADIIVNRSVGRSGERIDGEVAPLGVGLPVAPERDTRLAAERLDVLAQRRDLDRLVIDDDGDGAMLDAGRDRLAAGRRRRGA